jgi:hypothetical protein
LRITERDCTLIKDVALSHVLSRDQVIGLGYFHSVSRANVRLHTLVKSGFLAILQTPFHAQHLYIAGKKASDVVGSRIATLLATRRHTPRFLQHSLAVTSVRIKFADRGEWRFEQQVTDACAWRGRTITVRPDGLILEDSRATFLEIDMGHVNKQLFCAKLCSFEDYVQSGRFAEVYASRKPIVRVITVDHRRKVRLAQLSAPSALVTFEFSTFQQVGVQTVEGWS